MHTLFGRVVFTVKGVPYRWEDVVLAARAWGDWQELEAHVSRGLVLSREGDRPARSDVEAAARAFRYSRNLISAEETERWLTAWALTPVDWFDYLRRAVMRDRHARLEAAAPDAALGGAQSALDPDVDRVIKCEAACSGTLDRLALKLAGRAAIFDRMRPSERKEARADANDESLPHSLASYLEERDLATLPQADLLARARHITALDACFEEFRSTACSPKAVRDQINARYLDWLQVESEDLVLTSEDAAREAALCIRHDRQPVTTVAASAGTTSVNSRSYLEDIDPVFRPLFVAAKEGDLLGPLPSEGKFRLLYVRQRVLPSEHNADVRRRAEAAILQSALNREINSRVRWLSRQ
jgi:hypothetical protein